LPGKAKPRERFAGFWENSSRVGSDLPDVGRLGTFLPLSYLKAYTVAFSQRFETFRLNSREMNKNIGAGILLDEAIAFGIVEPFDCTFCHFLTPVLTVGGLGAVACRSRFDSHRSAGAAWHAIQSTCIRTNYSIMTLA
jgi:hypothetical protein